MRAHVVSDAGHLELEELEGALVSAQRTLPRARVIAQFSPVTSVLSTE